MRSSLYGLSLVAMCMIGGAALAQGGPFNSPVPMNTSCWNLFWQYDKKADHKAFAVSPKGNKCFWAKRATVDKAMWDAGRGCRQRAGESCKVIHYR